MAYEDHHASQQPVAPAAYDHIDPRGSYSTMHTTNSAAQPVPDSPAYRSRGPSHVQNDGYVSDASRYRETRRPINEAVTSAFQTSDSSAAAALSPEVLSQITSQITANVIQQLKASNLPAPSVPVPSTQPPGDSASSTTGSPPIDRATVYTPPSPFRMTEEATRTQGSPSRQATASYPAHANEKRAMSPSSQGSHADDMDARDEKLPRPQGPKRTSTLGDTTIMEKVWGKLFDQGHPTIRLGQFLRGIAIHLIEDYEPKHSLVITPAKLQRYYQETKLENEIYPWQVVFDDRTSSISRMFRDIEARHHLVQEKFNERPDIPGLTPQGFETWATLLIRAHPNEEYDRLVKTVLDMPISNPDDRKERFPKEVSRRLFPKESESAIAMKLQKAMSTHCNVPVTARNNSTAGPEMRPPPTRYRVDDPPAPRLTKVTSHPTFDKQDPVVTPVSSRGSPPPTHSYVERQRHPYSNTPSEAAIEDEDDVPTPQPIERERKPYVAQPGGGKNYDNGDKPQPTDYKNSVSDVKMSRTMSNAGGRTGETPRPRPAPISIHQNPATAPVDIPDSRRSRTNNAYSKDYSASDARAPSPRGGRNRSPSISKDGGFARRSETTTAYGSVLSGEPDEAIDDGRRYRDYETQRERLAGDKYDAARMSAYDPRDRDRERESRPRGQSISAYDNSKSAYVTDEEYYRSNGGYKTSPREGYPPYPSSAQYPPNAYREAR